MVGKSSADSGAAKTTPLGGKIWFCLLFFGLIGQIAWIVENMYFAKFMQDEFVDEAWATTLMVALSAIFATAATVVTGALCDKTGKRSVFVSWGFIVWGLTIMVFALFPIDYSPEQLGGLVAGAFGVRIVGIHRLGAHDNGIRPLPDRLLPRTARRTGRRHNHHGLRDVVGRQTTRRSTPGSRT